MAFLRDHNRESLCHLYLAYSPEPLEFGRNPDWDLFLRIFRCRGRKISGSPSIGFYSLPNLKPRWEKLGMNVQDVSFINATSSENLINQCIICGNTDQFLTLFSIASGDCPFPTEEDKLPSLINSVSWVSLNADCWN